MTKKEKRRENFFQALLYERDGDLNLTWLFVLLMGTVGCIGFIWNLFIGAPVLVQIASWSFLGGAFSLVVLAAIPISKAKILANSRVPGDMARSIASVAEHDPGVSTDIQESYQRTVTSGDNQTSEDKG